jgi:hypothetical protein
MEKDKQGSFTCFNCQQKNYFEKEKYSVKSERSTVPKSIEVSIACSNCREINVVKIEV